jgi:hypothetical protein
VGERVGHMSVGTEVGVPVHHSKGERGESEL